MIKINDSIYIEIDARNYTLLEKKVSKKEKDYYNILGHYSNISSLLKSFPLKFPSLFEECKSIQELLQKIETLQDEFRKSIAEIALNAIETRLESEKKLLTKIIKE